MGCPLSSDGSVLFNVAHDFRQASKSCLSCMLEPSVRALSRVTNAGHGNLQLYILPPGASPSGCTPRHVGRKKEEGGLWGIVWEKKAGNYVICDIET